MNRKANTRNSEKSEVLILLTPFFLLHASMLTPLSSSPDSVLSSVSHSSQSSCTTMHGNHNEKQVPLVCIYQVLSDRVLLVCSVRWLALLC